MGDPRPPAYSSHFRETVLLGPRHGILSAGQGKRLLRVSCINRSLRGRQGRFPTQPSACPNRLCAGRPARRPASPTAPTPPPQSARPRGRRIPGAILASGAHRACFRCAPTSAAGTPRPPRHQPRRNTFSASVSVSSSRRVSSTKQTRFPVVQYVCTCQPAFLTHLRQRPFKILPVHAI